MHLEFIGLRHIGRTIAGRLLGYGHTGVYNRTASKAEGSPDKDFASTAIRFQRPMR